MSQSTLLRRYLLILAGFIALLFCLFSLSLQGKGKERKVILFFPMQHKAFEMMARGFTDGLEGTEWKVEIENAQGDVQIHQAIVQAISHSSAELIVPVSTSTAQSVVQQVHGKPILCVAAMLTPEEKENLSTKAPPVLIIEDEVSPLEYGKCISILLKTRGEKRVTLLHSFDEKPFLQADSLREFLEGEEIQVRQISVHSGTELQASLATITPESGVLCILKESFMANLIELLSYTAQKHALPLIAADQGSVSSGAALGYGVSEYSIGREAARLALSLLHDSSSLPAVYSIASQAKLFVNSQMALRQGVDLDLYIRELQAENYSVEYVEKEYL